MSILLDALKKSEEQRQLGMAPTIHSGVDNQVDDKETMTHWLPVTLMALSVVVMAWFGWQQFRPPEPGGNAVQEQTPAEVPQAVPGQTETEQEFTEKTARPPSPGVETEQRTPVESFTPGEPEPSQTAETPPQVQAAPVPKDAESAPAPAADARPPPAPTPSEPQAEQAQARPAGTEPISYWELPQGIRDSLPEFRITVLVYAERPEDRFLLFNGQRMIEKDQLPDGLVLEEIRRGGAIFRYRNYRFLVKG